MKSKRDLPNADTFYGVSVNIIANSSDDELKSPNGGVKLGEHCKNATELVTEYLEQSAGRSRKAAITNVIRVMNELVELGDYNIASAMNAGLSKFQKDVDALPSSKDKTFIEEFQRLMAPAVAKTRFHHRDTIPLLEAGSNLTVIPPVGMITGQQYATALENFKGRKIVIAEGNYEGFSSPQEARAQAQTRFDENVNNIFQPVIQARNDLKPKSDKATLTYPQMTLLGEIEQRVEKVEELITIEARIQACWTGIGSANEAERAANTHLFFAQMADYIELSLDKNKQAVLQELALKLIDSPVLKELLELDKEARNQRMSERGQDSFSKAEMECVKYIDKLHRLLENVVKAYEAANAANDPQKQKDEIVKSYVNKISQMRNELGNLRDALHAEQLKHGNNSLRGSATDSPTTSRPNSALSSGIFGSRGRGSSILRSRITGIGRDSAVNIRTSNASAPPSSLSGSPASDSRLSSDSNRSSGVELIKAGTSGSNEQERELAGIIQALKTATSLARAGSPLVPLGELESIIEKIEGMLNVRDEKKRECLNKLLTYVDCWHRAESDKLAAKYPNTHSNEEGEYEKLNTSLKQQREAIKKKIITAYNNLAVGSAPVVASPDVPPRQIVWQREQRNADDMPSPLPTLVLSKSRKIARQRNEPIEEAPVEIAVPKKALPIPPFEQIREVFDTKMAEAKNESNAQQQYELYEKIVEFIHGIKGHDDKKYDLLAELQAARTGQLISSRVRTNADGDHTPKRPDQFRRK